MPWGRWAVRAAIVAALAAVGWPAGAQVGASLNRAGSGARAAGMADAFIAISDDGTAASWNPAGLAQLRQPEFSLVYQVNNRKLKVTGLRSADGQVAYSNRSFGYTNASPDFASAALPISIAHKPVTLQLGWHRLYQLTTRFGGAVDRYELTQPLEPPTSVWAGDEVLGDIDVFTFAGAVKLTSHAALGGSFDVWRGDWSERVTGIEDPGAGGSSSAFYFNESRQRLEGHNFTVGLLLTHPSWNAGLVYHSPFWSSFHIESDQSSSEAPPTSAEAPGRFRLPRSIGAGAAWRTSPRWTIALALTHDQWTEGFLDGLPGGRINFFDGLPPDLSTTRDTLSINLGAEHLFFLREGTVVPLRFGVGWEPQGAMDPVVRDPVEYLLLAVGAGYNTNRFKFDAALQYRGSSFSNSHIFTVASALAGGLSGGLARDAVGRVDTHEWRLKFSVIYRIPG